MKLPGFLKLKRGPGKPRARDGDSLAAAREQMLDRFREGPEPASQAPPVAPEVPTPAMGDAVVTAEGNGPVESSSANDDPLAAVAAAAPEDQMDSGLLDIFRDAKQEAEEASLADELEDVSIGDLLNDVVGLSRRLGVEPSRRTEPAPEGPPRAPVEEPGPEAHEDADSDDDSGGPPATALPDGAGDARAAPNETPVEPAAADEDAILEPEDAPGAGPGGDADSGAGATDSASESPPDGNGSGRRMILHALFLGLSLTLAGGLGIRAAQGGAVVQGPAPTPAVLFYLNPPVILETEGGPGEPEPTAAVAPASPTPWHFPTPAPTPPPAEQVIVYAFAPDQPAWIDYRVRSGDSLTSIAQDFGLCPDHILWNNPGREEEDPLRIGDRLLLPGYPGVVYRVGPGETLGEIGSRFSVDPRAVIAYPGNHLDSGQELRTGMALLLPDGLPPSALLQDEEAARAYTEPSQAGYIWPFYGNITTYFGEERPGYTHNAMDIGGLGHFGAPVLAAADGVATAVVHEDRVYGNYVIVTHADGSRTLYAHLSRLYVEQGEQVAQQQPLGALGCTGHSTGTHLHFELWIGGRPVDPLDYLP